MIRGTGAARKKKTSGAQRPTSNDQRLARRVELGRLSHHDSVERFTRKLGCFLHALGCCQRASGRVSARVGTLRTWRRNVPGVRRDASTARWKENVPNFWASQSALGGVLRVLEAMQRALQEIQRMLAGVQNAQEGSKIVGQARRLPEYGTTQRSSLHVLRSVKS